MRTNMVRFMANRRPLLTAIALVRGTLATSYLERARDQDAMTYRR